MIPSRNSEESDISSTSSDLTVPVFSLEAEEEKIANLLSKIEGAGQVEVVLTLKSSTEQELAIDEERQYSRSEESGTYEESISSSIVLASTGSGTDAPVTIKYIYPEYMGALVVSEGADSAAVQLQLVQAISALTGLSSDKITIAKMNIS